MKHIICVILWLSASVAAQACDVCGASGGNQNLGILPQSYRHFAALQYQQRGFNTSHPAYETGVPPKQADEQYHTLQAWGRYSIGERVQLFAFIPYQINTQLSNGNRTTSQGLGDVSLLANVAVVRTANETHNHLLFAGGGIKAPTGSYTGITARDKEGLLNMQPGTGSWDFPLNVNYTYSRKNAGINTEVSYTLTTANSARYKYGNRLNTSLTGFYRLPYNKLVLLPLAGLRYEYTLHDYNNYARKWLNEQTGGSMVYGSLGLHVYYGRIGLQMGMDLPVAQHYAKGNVLARYRANTGLLFLF